MLLHFLHNLTRMVKGHNRSGMLAHRLYRITQSLHVPQTLVMHILVVRPERFAAANCTWLLDRAFCLVYVQLAGIHSCLGG